jgi:lipoprotein NlpI
MGGNVHFSVRLVGVAALLMLAGPMSRALANDADTCAKVGGDEAIAACTRVIQNRGTSTTNRVMAYVNRGNAFDDKGDHERAIADYSEAILLNPKNPIAHDDRGDAYQAKGDNDRAIADYSKAITNDPKKPAYYLDRGFPYQAKGDNERAIADYNEAIRLDPKSMRGYFNRGLAELYAGALPKALVDLNQASALDPKYAYAALWLDIVGQRSGVPSRLSQVISSIDMTTWPAPVIRMFLGQMPPVAVLTAADDPDVTKKVGQVCEANFYSGELALRTNIKDEAARLFRLSSGDCPKDFIEWIAANAELKALGAAP